MASITRNDNDLSILDSISQEISSIEQIVNQHFDSKPINVLDAGCGRKWQIKLSMPYEITGVDADKNALAHRKDLDVAIAEDIQAVQFPVNQFDLIYCSYVLEHVRGAEKLLLRYLDWLKPGGLVVLRIPDKYSVYGFITRHTPLWAHVMYKKHLLLRKESGASGHGPYPTVYDEIVSRKGIQQFCRKEQVRLLGEWGTDQSVPKRGRLYWLRKATVYTVKALSFGRLNGNYNNLTFVIEKPSVISSPDKQVEAN